MARQKKSVLNQTIEEPQDEKNELVDETNEESDNEKGIFSDREPDFSQLKAVLENSNIPVNDSENAPQEPNNEIEPEKEIEEPVIEMKTRTIESLSYKELRLYQRTGQMPK